MATQSKAAKVPATKTPNFSNPDVFQLATNFKPAVSKVDGSSQLTFLGYEHSMSKDGDSGFIKLVFSVMDTTRNNPENIPILVSYRVSEDNKFGRVLNSMGCQMKAPEYDTEAVEDEYGLPELATDYSYVYDYLDTHGGYVYRAILTTVDDKPGLYRIDINSLKPQMKDDEQVKVDVT